MRALSRMLFGLVVVVLILGILGGAVGVVTVRRSFPQTSGEIRLIGLDGPVDIYRNAYGIPQIYASTQHDLFFAQGYVHAQDRFWQMDFWRHIGAGRLSEMFGESQLETDQFLRTMGWARVVQQELAQIDPDSLAILNAYADGINAYLADRQGSALSLEYAVLKLLNRGYKPEPWTPLNTLTWAKAMAWDLRGNMDEEVARAILLKTLSPQQVADLYPAYPADHPLIVSPATSGTTPQNSAQPEAILPELGGLLAQTAQTLTALDGVLGPAGDGIGSNNWVIAGKLTATGKPLLANDPHLSAQMPSIWYEIGLHCEPKGQGCPYEVTGFSFAGAPGVVIGHNDRIAWGMTNVGPDVMDLYIEKLNPANPNQYEVDGQWVDMTLVTETIQIAGKAPQELTVRYTRHGPVISDVSKAIGGFAENSGLELPQNFAVALRWTALEPVFTFRSLWEINRAQNWDEFRKATQDFAVPSQNLIYADVDGNIGYQMPGYVPIRAKGDGRLPVPGWTDEYEWTGYIPFEKLPNALNPPQGFIATANNAVVGADYPYLITTDWDYGYRAQRIVEMIESAPEPIDIPYIQKMQGDDADLNARTLVPVLERITMEDPHLKSYQEFLAGWDDQDRMDSPQAALFEAFWKHLLADAFGDNLPEDYQPEGGERWFEVVRRLIDQPDSPWWDNQHTPEVENRDQIFTQAFGEAVAELEKTQGKDPSKWAWGDLHTITFRNQTLGESGVGPIEALFNRGPFRTAGGSGIVNATGWDASSGDYTVGWLPSMRMIVDFSNLQNSLTVNTTGQSGHAYNPHYVDLADLWRNIQYHPMLWERSQVEAAGGEHLRLAP
jgi:penicillin amidase